ncbi:MAG: hypothetical protein JRJ68_08560 [Deltaproteobacteria bacterium]|nr:hypothetical protein [Deltaproteobacteria bacterium]
MDEEKTAVDRGVAAGLKIVSYVAGDDGGQRLVSGSVWQPVNTVNRQAWQEIERQIGISKKKIAAGKVSCLHYYMTANQMNTRLLARYTGQSRWRVRLHIFPFFFARLGSDTVRKYAEVFQTPAIDLIQGRLSPPVYDSGAYEINCAD